VDTSRKDAPDDFARDLQALRRSELCARCPEADRCGGLWERMPEDVWTRDDRRVRELVGALEGDVLDVGCGEGRYEGVVAERAAAGVVRWVGLEPDAARAAAMRRRAPWAEVREGEAGEAESVADRARFDHVLVLRSWNHLHDPRRATQALLAALRPGGSLVVVDNVGFGVLRPPDRGAPPEPGPAAPWEHFRNDDAARAHACISSVAEQAGVALELTERRDVAPGGSSEWLLRYQCECGRL
jgi:SAM-dependent methyltransferase